MDRNVILLSTAKGIRAFMQGYFVLIFPLYLHQFGIHAFGIGLFATGSLAVGVLYTVLLTRLSKRIEIRWLLLSSSLLMALSGVLFASAHSLVALIIAGLCGFVPPSGGMFQSALEQGVLSHVTSTYRTKAFSVYGFVAAAAGAIGSLASGWTGVLEVFGTRVDSDHVFLAVYAAAGLALAGMSTFVLQPKIHCESHGSESAGTTRHSSAKSKKAILQMAALYGADNFGSGLIPSTLMIYWLHVHFHMTSGELGVLYFGMDVLSAVSYPLAERLSRWFGLINTAVWTHLPCSLSLVLIPFLPNGTLAFFVLLLRSLLVEMDVPTRQSFMATYVRPEERTAAAAATSIGEQIGGACGPALGGMALQLIGASLPFVIAGALKSTCDLTMWALFRDRQNTSYAPTVRG